MSNVSELDADSRHLSPWMVIGGIVLLALVGAIALAIVAAALTPDPNPVPSGVAQAKLADGSVLVLHGITDAHQLELPDVFEPGWGNFFDRLFGRVPPKVTIHNSSYGSNSLTIWLARYDARTGTPLEFDRWSHSIVTTPAGTEVYDDRYASRTTRKTRPHSSTSSTSGIRPFQAIDPGSYSHIVYSSNIPRVRSSTGDVQIDVYHADDGHVATFKAPLPGVATSYPTWTPDPLPATAADGDLEVTLTSLSADLRTDPHSSGNQPRLDVRVETDVRQNGEASALWISRQVTLSDALGNEANPYDCTLSTDESAWKISMRLFRSDEAALLQGFAHTEPSTSDAAIGHERLVVEDILLPDTDPATLPNSTQTGDATIIDGVSVSLLGVGGPGKCEYRFKTKRTGRGTYAHGNQIQTEFQPPNATLSIDNDRRHIALKVEGDTADRRVVLLLTDQNGVRLKTDWPRQMEEARVWQFEADDWVTSVNACITVQRARNVEFTVAPPKPVAAE